MSDDPTPAPPPARRLVRALRLLLAGYLLYVAGFEIAVRSGFAERWLNRKPHRLAVAFDSAHSWFPFWGTVSGLDARGQARRLRWQAHVDRASGWLSPVALFGRRLRILGARADGIELRLRFDPAAAGAPEDETVDGAPGVAVDESWLPPIPPLAEPPPGPPAVPRWTIEAPGFSASGVREVWLDQFRLRSDLDAAGSLTLHLPTRELAMRSTRAKFAAGTLTIGDEVVGEALAGDAVLTIERFPFQEKRGLAALPFVSAIARIESRLSGGRLSRRLLPPQAWFELDDAPATVTANLILAAGRLEPGTRAEIRQPGYEARAFGFRLRGDLEARFEVSRDAEGPRGDATASVANFEVRRGDDERPELVGSGLSVLATTRDLDLSNVARTRAKAKVDLGEARLPDLASVADLLPAAANLALTGGSGAVTGKFDVELPAFAARGAVEADLTDVSVHYSGLDITGRMRLQLALATAHLPSGRFDLAGSRFDLSEFTSPQIAAEAESASEKSEGWWARIELPEGGLVLPPATAASGRLEIRLRDSIPFVGLFETRRNLPGWVERLLTVHDLAAQARFAYTPDEFALDEFEMPFKRATIHARMRFGAAHKAGVMRIDWRKLALGLRFDDDRRKFKLTGVRDWYAAQNLDRPAADRPPRPEELFSEEAFVAVPFSGVVELPVSLAEAEMELDEKGGDAATSAPPYEFVPGSITRGDLDGDGRDDGAVLIRRPNPTGEPSLFLAVVVESEGRVRNVATAAISLDDRPAIAGLRIAEGILVLELVPERGGATATPAAIGGELAPTDPAASSRPLRFRFADGALLELPEEPAPAAAAPPP